VNQGGMGRCGVAGMETTRDVRRRHQPEYVGVVFAAFAQIAIEIDVQMMLP
jgi:hypothetical protein